MDTRLLSAICQLIFVWASSVSGFSSERTRRNVANFDQSQLLGEWYDVGRTTYIWGPDTWTSQQWNFVQGRDGTVVALFNGMCKVCGGCSDTIVFRVRRRPDVSGVFLLEGNGETLSVHVMSRLRTAIVVSICFKNGGVLNANDCPKSKLQVSVLSRQRMIKDLNRWKDIIRELPVAVEDIDSSSGERCSRLYIDRKLVTSGLTSDTDTLLTSKVGFNSPKTSIVLPCALGEHASSENNGSRVVWLREQTAIILTEGRNVTVDHDGLRVLDLGPGQYDLLLQRVTSQDSDVYTCLLDTGKKRIKLSRVAVSSGKFKAGPSVVYHSSNVTAVKGNTAVLECYVNGNPPPQLSWWIKTSDQPETYLQKDGRGNRLKINNLQADDEGVYKCEASNKVGGPVFQLLNLYVGFAPETEVKDTSVSLPFGGDAVLTCYVMIKSTDTMVWQKDGADVIPDFRHSVSLIQRSEYRYELRLVVRRMSKDDFGRYVCLAKDEIGESSSAVDVIEQPLTGDECRVSNIPVVRNFNVQQFLGDMETMHTTRFYWGNYTYPSLVQGFFITISGSLVQYYRGFSPQKKQCVEPEASTLVRLDTPGDYLVSFGGERGRYKIVYTDYTHAVTYFCMSGDDREACPQHLVHVEILSRLPHIPDDVLQRLYTHVQKTCVPVTSLMDTVPGVCKMPPDFMYSKGWIGSYPEPNCQVANLPVQEKMRQDHVIGDWHLIGEVRPSDYTALPRQSLHIVPSRDRLVLFYRGVRSGLCSATEADIFYKSLKASSYYFDLNGLTVDSKFLYVDEKSLVTYTCLALRHDGTCYSGAQLVELYHRDLHMEDYAMLWLIRAIANSCVDIEKLKRLTPSDTCPVPKSVLKGVDAGLINGDHTQIGCHKKLITIAEDFSVDKFTGHWLVIHRNRDSFTQPQDSLSQFSQTYVVVKRPKGRLLLLVRHYESEWGSCPPTRVLKMKETSRPGDYIHSPRLNGKVVFKVLSLSRDTAVVYWCNKFRSDGVCRPDSLTVEILARQPSQTDISAETLRDLQQCSVNVCVKLENLQPTSQTAKCDIPEKIVRMAKRGRLTTEFDVPVVTCKGRLLKGVLNVNVEKLTGEWTVLWRNEKFWNKRAPHAESSFIILTHYGLLYLWRSYENELEQCGPEEAGRFIRTSSPGDYYSGFDGVPVAMKILQTDYVNMLVIWCHLDDNSRCHPHRTTIEILSRNATMDNATRDDLMAAVDTSCLDSPLWVPSEPDMCRVENDVLTAAYIDGIVMEYTKIGCRVDLIYGQPAVTEDMIVGTWRSVFQSRLSESEGAAASTVFHFTKTADGPISLLFRLFSIDKKECLPAQMLELTRDNTNRGTAFELKNCGSTTPYGYMYVLLADEDRLAVLLCKMQQKGRLCDPSTQNLVLMHREGKTIQMDSELLDTVRGLGADVCVDHLPLVVPTLEPCAIPQPILTDAASGELEACAYNNEVQCYPQYIPVHGSFDVREFSGRWYTTGYSAVSEWSDYRLAGSTAYHFVPGDDGTVTMLYSSASSAGPCHPTEMRLLTAAGEGSFMFTFNNTEALLKIVWMDEDLAVTYWCFDAGSGDPWCQQPAYVSLLSRQWKTGKDAELPSRLRPVLNDICVSSHDFVSVDDTEPCVIPSNIVGAVENDTSAVTTSFSVIQCAEQFVIGLDDFDVKLFSGVWHTVRQTERMWGNNTWESLIRSFVVRADGTTVMAFTGHPPGEGHCVPMEVKSLRQSQQAGQWTYSEGSHTVTVKVVWTDYNDSALLYTCGGQVGQDGLCQEDSLQVEYLSRTPSLSPGAEEDLSERLPGLCVEDEQMDIIRTGLCQITKDLKHIVGSARDGATEPLTSCRVQDIPLEKNFTIRQSGGSVELWMGRRSESQTLLQYKEGGNSSLLVLKKSPQPIHNYTDPPLYPKMTGTWYEIARTRFTFNTMESVISVYDYNPDRDLLEGLFVGTLNKQCQSPLKSTTKKKFADGADSIIEGRIQAGESIFPWITFNIIYFDGDVMLHMACYVQNEDGTCPRDKTEVTLLGRSRELPEEMEEKLDRLMKSVCLTRKDLVPTKELADCLPMLLTPEDTAGLPDTSACQLTDIPVVQNLDEENLLGTWYGLGSVDYGSASEPSGFVLSISRITLHTLKWRQWNIRNGSCQAEKAIYMKAACTGSNKGDYISTRASSFMLQWTTVKILRYTGDMLLVYKCMQENHEGVCRPEGIRVDLLGRSPSATLDDMIPLLSALPSVCLKPENMKPVQSTADCDRLASEVVPVLNTSPCSVDHLPTVNVDMTQISGLWYEVAHTVDVMLPMQKAVIVYKELPGNQMAMYLSAVGANGQCLGPMEGRMRQRCHSNPGPEVMGRLKFPGFWSWAPWRLLHSDKKSLIVLSCMDEQPDGSCSTQGLKILSLSRDPNPPAKLRQRLQDKLESSGCFKQPPTEEVYHEGLSCKHKLNPILTPAA